MIDSEKWISVKDKLPEIPCVALWSDGVKTFLEEGHSVKMVTEGIIMSLRGNKEKVTHWMPLPEQPKEGTDD